ncbi:flagellar biosynthetic protein FliO [Ligilactobacillus sp.]|uniref:flagellar biosynthetic protein FliO n=1 Tax=Ligilactobacillus sp. TaxID=2767921 RepID=UPI002FE0621D
MDGILALVKMIAGLVVVLLLLVLTLKYLNRFTNRSNENFRVVKKIAVTKSSSLAIVLIIDKYYVMSFSEQENKIIRELSEEEAEKLIQENRQNEERQLEMAENFRKIFEKAKRK